MAVPFQWFSKTAPSCLGSLSGPLPGSEQHIKAIWVGGICCASILFMPCGTSMFPSCLGSLGGALPGPDWCTKAPWLFGLLSRSLLGFVPCTKTSWLRKLCCAGLQLSPLSTPVFPCCLGSLGWALTCPEWCNKAHCLPRVKTQGLIRFQAPHKNCTIRFSTLFQFV